MNRSVTLPCLDGSAAVITVTDDPPGFLISHHPDSLQAADHRIDLRPEAVEALTQFAGRFTKATAAAADPPRYGPLSLVYTASDETTHDLARADLSELTALEHALAVAVVQYAAERLHLYLAKVHRPEAATR